MPMVFEPPDVPSPRTIPFSAHNKKELSTWWSCHSTLLADASRFKPLTSAPHLVLFGDSITESWRGTSYGKPVPRTSGVPGVLRETLAQSWPSVMPLGIAADMTQHLLWRLQRGELSASVRADAQLRMALLIGTNNLGKGHQAGGHSASAHDAELAELQEKTLKLLNANDQISDLQHQRRA